VVLQLGKHDPHGHGMTIGQIQQLSELLVRAIGTQPQFRQNRATIFPTLLAFKASQVYPKAVVST
jgi:hypothetical protein